MGGVHGMSSEAERASSEAERANGETGERKKLVLEEVFRGEVVPPPFSLSKSKNDSAEDDPMDLGEAEREKAERDGQEDVEKVEGKGDGMGISWLL